MVGTNYTLDGVTSPYGGVFTLRGEGGHSLTFYSTDGFNTETAQTAYLVIWNVPDQAGGLGLGSTNLYQGIAQQLNSNYGHLRSENRPIMLGVDWHPGTLDFATLGACTKILTFIEDCLNSGDKSLVELIQLSFLEKLYVAEDSYEPLKSRLGPTSRHLLQVTDDWWQNKLPDTTDKPE